MCEIFYGQYYYLTLSFTQTMNSYFSLSSTTNPNDHQYETDYTRGNFRLTNKDSTLMNTYSNFNMMQTGLSTSHHQQIHFEQHQTTNDYLLPTSNGTSSWKPIEPIPSSTFSMSVTNPMLYYTHPWMRPGIHKLIKRKMIYWQRMEYLT